MIGSIAEHYNHNKILSEFSSELYGKVGVLSWLP